MPIAMPRVQTYLFDVSGAWDLAPRQALLQMTEGFARWLLDAAVACKAQGLASSVFDPRKAGLNPVWFQTSDLPAQLRGKEPGALALSDDDVCLQPGVNRLTAATAAEIRMRLDMCPAPRRTGVTLEGLEVTPSAIGIRCRVVISNCESVAIESKTLPLQQIVDDFRLTMPAELTAAQPAPAI